MSHTKTAVVALAGLAAFGTGAMAFDRYRDLRDTRANAQAAWVEIGGIHAARARNARATLGAPQKVLLPAAEAEKARTMLSQVRALPADPALLDDPKGLDTYKRYQGELTGALFSLAFGARTASGAPALGALQAELTRNEAALAQARQRYRQAADRHNALAATLPGTLVGMLTGQGMVPPEL